jgi:NADPH:quinone reductase-like Zn-dependent oxidoreductase
MAIQVGKALGATVVATAGSEEKLALCRDLGADVAINYRDADFAEVTRDATDGHGADVILDIVGAKYLASNLSTLAMDGRLVVIGMQGGAHAELDLTALMRTRGSIHVTGLRSRPLEQKAAICAAVVEGLWPMIADGRVRPIVGATYPMDRIAEAHRLVADSGHTGKVVLTAR